MRRIILDVDTGSDDAIAIISAAFSAQVEIAAICTTSNLPIEVTTANTLKVLNLIGKNIPVYRGAPRALVKNLSPLKNAGGRVNQGVEINGKTVRMHEPFDLEQGTQRPEQQPASIFYLEYLRNAVEPVTIVITGLATNLALALTMDPTIVKNIEEIVMMCGGYKVSNVTLCAESNAWRDPEATQIVIGCGAEITMIPLDATHAVALDAEDIEVIKKIESPAAEFCVAQIEQRMLIHQKTQPLEGDGVAIHDALCIAYLVSPEILTETRRCYCQVDCSDGPAQGQTIIDNRHFTAPPNITMAFKANQKMFVEFLVDTLRESERHI